MIWVVAGVIAVLLLVAGSRQRPRRALPPAAVRRTRRGPSPRQWQPVRTATNADLWMLGSAAALIEERHRLERRAAEAAPVPDDCDDCDSGSQSSYSADNGFEHPDHAFHPGGGDFGGGGADADWSDSGGDSGGGDAGGGGDGGGDGS